jgi:WD40 repeat protein
VYGKKQGQGDAGAGGITFLVWAPVRASAATRRASYSLAFAVQDRVHVAALEFDFRIMRYSMATTLATMPATGFNRVYSCATIEPSGRMLLAGTTAGEVAVYTLLPAGGALYKTALMAAANGVHSIVGVRGGEAGGAGGGRPVVVYAGGGDGSVRCFQGASELAWTCTGEARLQGRVVAASLAASGGWMLAGTGAGHVYRVSFGCNLHAGVPPSGGARPAVDLLEASHSGPVLALAFHPAAPDAVATASSDQTVRLWNLNTYGVTWGAYAASGPHPSVLWVAHPFDPTGGNGGAGNGGGGGGGAGRPAASAPSATGPGGTPGVPCDVYAGFSDGTLRSYGVTAAAAAVARGASAGEAWRVNAHRGGVTCIAGNRAVVVTGGADGRVNVWARRSHDLLLSFNDHSRGVIAVLVDCANPELVYSVAADRTINTYSLRAERRIRQHALPQPETTACTFTAMAQLCGAGSERELVAATSDGRVFLYDPAVPDMHVGAVDVLTLLAMRARALAGGGVGGAAAGAAPDGGVMPRARPGQTRPELRFTAAAVSPSGAFLALTSACGRVIILSPAPDAAAELVRRPVTTFTDLSGTVRQQVTSPASHMRVAAAFVGGTPYTGIQWAPDEKQLVAAGGDGSMTVFNWYGS